MDIHCRIRYHRGNETPWIPRATAHAARAGHWPASVRQDLSINSRDPEFLNKFGGTLGSGSSQGWLESTSAQACFWTPADASAPTEAAAAAVAGKGFPVRRIYDGPVDPAAHIQADREIFRNTLSSRPCVAGDAGLGLDLPETGAAGFATGRESHRALEGTRLAAFKKKPKNLGPISSFSTRPASSSSLTSVRPGHQSGRLRFSSTAIGGIGFPLSPASPCRHPESVSDCIFASTRATSLAWRSLDSCVTFCGTCEARWCSFGTAARSTGASSSESSFKNTSGSMCIAFPPMPQNSIRMSSSGPRQSTLSPMARHSTSRRLGRNCVVLFTEFAGPRNCYGPASMHPVSHGHVARHIH